MITRTLFTSARRFLVFAACFCIGRHADATAIVYVKYPGGYIVGADSLISLANAHGMIVNHHYDCKLYVEEVTKTVFAVSGNTGQKGPQDVEELSKPVRQSLFGSADSRNEALYHSLMQNQQFTNKLSSSIEPSVHWVFIDSKDAAEGTINFHTHQFDIDPGGHADVLGWPNHAKPRLVQLLGSHFQNGSLPERDEAVDAVRRSLLEGEKRDSWIIGGKLSLLAVDGAGIHWIEQGECKGNPK